MCHELKVNVIAFNIAKFKLSTSDANILLTCYNLYTKSDHKKPKLIKTKAEQLGLNKIPSTYKMVVSC